MLGVRNVEDDCDNLRQELAETSKNYLHLANPGDSKIHAHTSRFDLILQQIRFHGRKCNF